jgi:hypothetical protein
MRLVVLASRNWMRAATNYQDISASLFGPCAPEQLNPLPDITADEGDGGIERAPRRSARSREPAG